MWNVPHEQRASLGSMRQVTGKKISPQPYKNVGRAWTYILALCSCGMFHTIIVAMAKLGNPLDTCKYFLKFIFFIPRFANSELAKRAKKAPRFTATRYT
jgi:hypothetical protein